MRYLDSSKMSKINEQTNKQMLPYKQHISSLQKLVEKSWLHSKFASFFSD